MLNFELCVMCEKSNTLTGDVDKILSHFAIIRDWNDLHTKKTGFKEPVTTKNIHVIAKAIQIESYFI